MKILGIGIIAFALFILQYLVYKRFWDKNLHVSIGFQQSGISEGEIGELVEVVENRKFLPLVMLKVKFQTSRNLVFLGGVGSNVTDQYYRNDIFQVGSGEKITRRLQFRGNKRGYYRIKNIDLIASDLFFMNENIKNTKTEQYLYVYPSVFTSDEFHKSLQKLNGEILVKRHLLEDPFEYRGIREYQAFDDMRSINWKATARTGQLKVNQKNYTAMQTIRIFLNLEDNGLWKKEKEVEACMQIAMGIARSFLVQGMKVSCYANGRDILSEGHIQIKGVSGIGQLETIGKAFARVDTSKDTIPFCELFERQIAEEAEGFFTFFVSPNGYTEFIDLLTNCQRQRIEFCWYYPVMQGDEVEIPTGLEKTIKVIHL